MKKKFLLLVCLIGIELAAQTSKSFELENQYLNFPVSFDKENFVELQLVVNDEVVRTFDLALSYTPDYWTFMDVSDFKGSAAVLRTKNNSENKGLDLVYHSDERVYLDDVYHEKYRPQFHFTTMVGWINDPNGLIYYDGEYHLFYQHDPFSGGNPNWGHAVSSDLIHWKQLPIALYPDELGVCYSGSAVIDFNNTSGLKTGDENVMVAFYTSHSDQNEEVVELQSMAYSNDRGRTWTKYEGNPIIGDRRAIAGNNDIRDPQVFWHEPTQKWIMVLFEGMGNSIFTSDNLIDWEYQSHVFNTWECPELFELPVDGDPDNTKWVMYGAASVYMIGEFDGKTFIPESGKHYYATGKKESIFKHKGIFYASQTFDNEPNGRRIQTGWGIIPHYKTRFNQMHTFPNELTLRTTEKGIRLFANPIKEIELLHKNKKQLTNIREPGDLLPKLNGDLGKLLHIKAEFEMGPEDSFGVFGLRINGFEIEYDARHNRLNDAFLDIDDRKIYLEILVDRLSVEVYGNHGRLYMADSHNSVDESGQLELYHLWGEVHLSNLEIYELKSIWDNKE